MVVRGVKELILAIKDCLQPFEDGDDLRPDDGEEVRWVAACEGWEGQCRDPVLEGDLRRCPWERRWRCRSASPSGCWWAWEGNGRWQRLAAWDQRGVAIVPTATKAIFRLVR